MNKKIINKLILNFTMIISALFGISSNSLATDKTESNDNAIPPIIIPQIGSRSLTGADAFPPDTISLSDVFRPAIGSGPNLLNEGKALQIVGQRSQTGAIWSKRQIDLLQDFSFTGYIYLGDGTNGYNTATSSVADGVTMVFQNDSRMTTNPSSVIGPGGAALGVYSVNAANSNNYIKNAISLEFDPYRNGAIDATVGVTTGGHVAVMIPQARNDLGTGRNHYGLITASPIGNNSANRLSNNTWRELNISWKASTRTLTYKFENFGQNSYTVDNLQTTFGGTKVYWGFTGATGALSMDARIAMTEIPGSAEQNLQVENITKGIPKNSIVDAAAGDTVKFNNVFQPDSDAVLSGSSASIELNLPDGIEYKSGSAYLDGTKIPDENVNVSGQTITLKNQNLTKVQNYSLDFEADVTSTQNNLTLDTTVKLFSSYGSIWSTSNIAQVKIKKSGTVIYYYVDEDGKEISPQKKMSGYIGDSYSETYIQIPDYEYVRTEGESSGQFSEETKNVYFYYKSTAIPTIITIKYVDGNGVKLHEDVTIDVFVNDTINLLDNSENKTAIQEVLLKNYTLPENGKPSDESNYLVKKDSNIIIYTFTGLLKADFSLPDNLNFGSHPIQYTSDETFRATLDGIQSETAVDSNGTISVLDTRANKPGWELKVRSSSFSNSTTQNSLSNTQLKIGIGNILNFDNYSNKTLILSPNTDVRIIQADAGSGVGQTEIPVNKFELYVPKDTKKDVNIYKSEVIWTLSDTPN